MKKIVITFLCAFLLLSCESTGNGNLEDLPIKFVEDTIPELIETPANENLAEILPETDEITGEMPQADILPETSQEIEPLIESEPIIIGQSIEVNEGQYLDILFPGQGWIYLGEVSATEPPVVNFSARQTEGADTLFVLQSKNIGSTVLHFYKQDVLENAYIDEYIEIIVMSEYGSGDSNISILAGGLEETLSGVSSEPEVSLVQIPEREIFEDESISTIEAEVSLNALFEQAQIAYNEQRYTDSLALLDNYFAQSINQLDRAWFLYGQIYEANSDLQNIRKALDAYETLVSIFPDSNLWNEAKDRTTYIERFYFNIR